MNDTPLAREAALEEVIDRFEQGWLSGDSPRLKDFVSHDRFAPAERHQLLVELIAVDLEYRWRRADRLDAEQACPRVESYLDAWPELGNSPSLAQLAAEEYRVRHRWGDRPTMDEYLQRYADHPMLEDILDSVRQDLQREETASDTSPGDAMHTTPENRPLLSQEANVPLRNFGRYQLLRVLGHGGMGEVYLAHDTLLERSVALKIPLLEIHAPRLRARFTNEAKSAATLRHPNICPVFDAGEIGGQPFLSMAYIEGETLREKWRYETKMQVVPRLVLLRKIARAMQAAHDAGIIHRDLKPSNVMIDCHGEPIVMDFGLARRVTMDDDERITHTGETWGSPGYMSPEQIEGKSERIGPASDIYSLGVMLFESLTGELPFRGSVNSILISIARDEPPRPTSIVPEIDDELEQLCLEMLQKDPARRPKTMAEVAARLAVIGKRLETDEAKTTAPLLPPQSVIPRRRIKATRRSVLLGAVAALVLMLGFGAALITIETPAGTVTIEVAPELAREVQVRVLQDGQVVEVANGTRGWSIQLQEGTYEFQVGSGDDRFKVQPQRVEVLRNTRAVVSITTQTADPADMQNIPPPQHLSNVRSTATEPLSDLALQLNGKGDHVVTPIIYDGSHPLTVEAWVAAADPWETGLVFSNRGPSGFSLGQYVHDRNPVWQSLVFRDGHPAALDLFTQPFRNPKCHIALVWDGTRCQFFYNGQLHEQASHRLLEMPASDMPIILGTTWAGSEIDRHTDNMFAGLINEVRISRVARYSEPFVPSARMKSDDDTLALYHCDEMRGNLLPDASDNGNDATVVGATLIPAIRMGAPGPYYEQLEHFLREAARPMPPRQGPALELLQSDARVEIPAIEYDFTEPFTVECWANPSLGYSPLANARNLLATPGFTFKIHRPSNLWMMAMWENNRGLEVSTMRGGTVAFNHRTHIALQWNGKRLQLFLNGRLCPGQALGRGKFDHLTDFIRKRLAANRSAPMVLGNHLIDDWEQEGQAGQAFGGTIDAFRFSRGARYHSAFEPQTLKPDENTVLLYDFSEGDGEILHDRSGNKHHGRIVGARWLPAPPETARLPGIVARPAELNGIRRWQVETRWPRAQLSIQQFSPDGKLFALGSQDGYIRIFKGGPTGSLQSICHVPGGQHGFLFDWAPDSKHFVTAAAGSIRTWTHEAKPMDAWAGDVEGLAWSPQGDWIAGSSRRGVVQMWNPAGMPGPLLRLSSSSNHSGISWAPDGLQLVAFSGTTVVIGTVKGEFTRTLMVDSAVRHVAWSRNGDRIAVITSVPELEIWEPTDGPVQKIPLPHHSSQSWGWSPDGRLFGFSTSDRLLLWDHDGNPVWETSSPQLHSEVGDMVLAWTPDGQHILVPKRDRSILLHRVSDGDAVERFAEEAPRISNVDWNERRQLWAASAWGKRPLRLFRSDGVPAGPYWQQDSWSFDVAWQADGEAVLLADGGALRRFGVSSEDKLQADPEVLLEGTEYRLVAAHPAGKFIATVSGKGIVTVLDGQGHRIPWEGHPDANALAFSPDGRYLAAATWDSVLLWDTQDWREQTIAAKNHYAGIAWAPDSRRIATVSDRNAVEIFDIQGNHMQTVEIYPSDTFFVLAL